MKTVYIILSFCVGLFLGYLIFPSSHKMQAPSMDQISKTEVKLNSIDTTKLAAEVHFKRENDSLKNRLRIVSGLLSIHKSQLKAERSRVLALTHRITQDTLVRAHSLLADSLSAELAELNSCTDSLMQNYERKAMLLEQMVAVRDSQMIVCNKSYSDMKDLLREQELRELQLSENLNTALKENKRQRFKNRVLSAGLLFVSGIAATLYLKSKQ